MKPVRLLKVALGKLKKVVSVQTINTTGEYPLFRYCFHISSPGIITLEKEWYPHFRLYIGRFPHVLDKRQFIGKPRNVDTLCGYYIGRFPHFLDIRQFMEKPRNVDTLLYREVSTFFDGKPSHCRISKKCGNLPIYSKVSTFLGFSMNCRISKNVELPPYIEKYPHFWAFP